MLGCLLVAGTLEPDGPGFNSTACHLYDFGQVIHRTVPHGSENNGYEALGTSNCYYCSGAYLQEIIIWYYPSPTVNPALMSKDS